MAKSIYSIAFSLVLICLGPGKILAQELKINGSAHPTTSQFIDEFSEFSSIDILPSFFSSGQEEVRFALPTNFEFSNKPYDSALFVIDPFVFGFPDNFYSTQFGMLNTSIRKSSIKEFKIFESDSLTSVFIRGISYKYFSCQTPGFDPDSAAVRVDFYVDRITVYMKGIPTFSCPEFQIQNGLPGFSRYQILSWWIRRAEGGNFYRSGFGSDSTFDGSIDQLYFQPVNNRGPFPILVGGFPEIPVRLDIISDSISSTFENPTESEDSGRFLLSNGKVTFLDKAGNRLKITALNSIGQILFKDVFEIDIKGINSRPIIVRCATVDGIQSKLFYLVE